MSWINAVYGPQPSLPYLWSYLLMLLVAVWMGVAGLIQSDRVTRDLFLSWLRGPRHWWLKTPIALVYGLGVLAIFCF